MNQYPNPNAAQHQPLAPKPKQPTQFAGTAHSTFTTSTTAPTAKPSAKDRFGFTSYGTINNNSECSNKGPVDNSPVHEVHEVKKKSWFGF